MVFKSLPIWFSLLDHSYFESDGFSNTLFTSVNALTIPTFLIEADAAPLLTLVLNLDSSWWFKSLRPNFTNSFINPFILCTHITQTLVLMIYDLMLDVIQ